MACVYIRRCYYYYYDMVALGHPSKSGRLAQCRKEECLTMFFAVYTSGLICSLGSGPDDYSFLDLCPDPIHPKKWIRPIPGPSGLGLMHIIRGIGTLR
uniref:Uncharacterized protein n=1 Tax=Romanomermis culicivorax TaxID=13658 RepID=A0A915HZ45_ROMCU